jgi:hypothetical protein
MFIHKYVVDGHELFLVSEKASRISGILNVSPDDWHGRTSGASVSNAVKFINSLKFKKDAPEAEPEEESEEKKKANNLTPVVQELDAIADEIQGQDPVVAYLIDRISDQLEGKKK